MPRLLERAQFVPQPISDVFAFFANAGNLETITPPSLHFSVITPQPIAMRAGTLIDYRLRLNGIPIRWRTRIELFEPESRFVDVQLRGPYRLWHHLHEFYPTAGGTVVVDRVHYQVGWSLLGPVCHALYVRRSLEHIFDYRRGRIAELLGADDNAIGFPPRVPRADLVRA